MIRCTKCQTINPDDAVFCSNCNSFLEWTGVKIDASEAAAEQAAADKAAAEQAAVEQAAADKAAVDRAAAEQAAAEHAAADKAAADKAAADKAAEQAAAEHAAAERLAAERAAAESAAAERTVAEQSAAERAAAERAEADKAAAEHAAAKRAAAAEEAAAERAAADKLAADQAAAEKAAAEQAAAELAAAELAAAELAAAEQAAAEKAAAERDAAEEAAKRAAAERVAADKASAEQAAAEQAAAVKAAAEQAAAQAAEERAAAERAAAERAAAERAAAAADQADEPAAVRPMAIRPTATNVAPRRAPTAPEDQPEARKPTLAIPKARPEPEDEKPIAIEARPGDVICPVCSTPNDPARTFCRRCGHVFAAPVVIQKPPPWWRRIFQRKRRVALAGERPKRVGEAGQPRPSVLRRIAPLLVVAIIAFGATSLVIPGTRAAIGGVVTDLKLRFLPEIADVHPVGATGEGVGSNTAKLAIDDNTATFWLADPAAGDPALTVDIGSKINLGGLVVHSGSSTQSDFPKHRRPKTIELTFPGTDRPAVDQVLADTSDPQPVSLDVRGVETVVIRVVDWFESGAGGDQFVAIREIEFKERR
jgi:ribosomal protein L40E